MTKKPFSIRVEEKTTTEFRALAVVLSIKNEELLNSMLSMKKEKLTEKEYSAFVSLLELWESKE